MSVWLFAMGGLAQATEAADAPPPVVANPAWMDVLVALSGRDGRRLTAEAATAALEEHCAAGVEVACGAAWAQPFDLKAAAEALGPACEQGVPSACVVVGWATGARDPEAALKRYRRACEAGLPRACTEVGLAMAEGRGTPRDRQGAYKALVPVCRDGEGRACMKLAELSAPADRGPLWAYAAEVGTPWGLEAMGRDLEEGPEAREALDLACEKGRPSACTELGRLLWVAQTEADAFDPEEADEGAVAPQPPGPDEPTVSDALGRACALDPLDGCARLLTWRAQQGEVPVEEAVAAFRQVCEERPDDAAGGYDLACWHQRLLEAGAEPRAWLGEELPPLPLEGLEIDLRKGVYSCYLERVWRGDARGGVEVLVQVGPYGVIEGAAAVGQMVDDEMSACVSRAALEVEHMRDHLEKAQRGLITYRLDHEAEVEFRNVGIDAQQDKLAAQEALERHAIALDECALELREKDPLTLIARVRVGRKGQARVLELQEGTENEALDACVFDLLGQKSEEHRLLSPLDGLLILDFMEYADPDRLDPEIVLPPEWTGPPAPWRVLGLVVSKHETEDGQQRMRNRDVGAIREAHAELEAFLAEHSGGQVQVTTEIREVDADLHAVVVEQELDSPMFMDEDVLDDDQREQKLETGVHRRQRFLVEPGDLDPALAQQVDAGAWDMVVVWVPMPWSEGYADLVTAWREDHLRGATFGALPVYPGSPRVEWLLRATLPLFAVRAGEGFELPSPHEPVRLGDGRYFDGRPWAKTADLERWYGWVAAEVATPEFWSRAAEGGPELLVAEGNLAPSATPTSSRDVRGAEQLNDRVLGFGAMPTGARQDSIAVRPPDGSWFGLTFDGMTTVSRVVAHLEGVEAASLQVTQDGYDWVEVARIEPVRTEQVTFTLPQVPVFALRVRVDIEQPDVPLACREIEVYAE